MSDLNNYIKRKALFSNFIFLPAPTYFVVILNVSTCFNNPAGSQLICCSP